MKTTILSGTIVLFFTLGIVGADDNPQTNDAAVEEMTAEEIATHFAKMPSEFSNLYVNHQLRITGEVEKVDGKNVYLKHYRAEGSVSIIMQTPDTPEVGVGDEVRATASITGVFAGTLYFKCKNLEHLKTIQGTWGRMALQNSASQSEEDWRIGSDEISFLQKKLRRSSDEHKQWDKATYTVDATATPCMIDLKTSDGKKAEGIYLMADDVLVVCLSKAGRARPTEFTAKPNDGQELLTFQRQTSNLKKLE